MSSDTYLRERELEAARERTLTRTVGALVGAVLVMAVAGMASCTARTWRFEDACRRAGGVLVAGATVTPSADRAIGDQVCVRPAPAPMPVAIPLPEYGR